MLYCIKQIIPVQRSIASPTKFKLNIYILTNTYQSISGMAAPDWSSKGPQFYPHWRQYLRAAKEVFGKVMFLQVCVSHSVYWGEGGFCPGGIPDRDPLDRDPLDRESPDRDSLGQRLPGQRPLDRGPTGQRSPGQRPLDRDPRQRPIPDRDPPWTETPYDNERVAGILLECNLVLAVFFVFSYIPHYYQMCAVQTRLYVNPNVTNTYHKNQVVMVLSL